MQQRGVVGLAALHVRAWDGALFTARASRHEFEVRIVARRVAAAARTSRFSNTLPTTPGANNSSGRTYFSPFATVDHWSVRSTLVVKHGASRRGLLMAPLVRGRARHRYDEIGACRAAAARAAPTRS